MSSFFYPIFVDISSIMFQDIELNKVVFFPIERMMRKVKEVTVKEFKENNFPVTKDQWIILKRISEINGSTQKEIANTTFKDPAALTRIIDLLEKKGLVKRYMNAEDRRTHSIHLSVDGSRLVNKMTPIVQQIRAKTLKGIDAKDLQLMTKTINKMYKNM